MAVTTAAIVGAGAAVSGAVTARKAGKAAEAQGEAQAVSQEQGLEETRRQFDITEQRLNEAEDFRRQQLALSQEQIAEDRAAAKPFQEAATGALAQQQALIGLSGSEAQQQALTALQESPGQQFLRKRAERSLLRNASAIGGLGGGNVRTALQEQAVGLAQQDIGNQFGRLGQIAGQRGGGPITTGDPGALAAASSLGQFGAQNVAAQNQARQSAAEARASGVFGKQQANAQGIQQLLQGAGQFASAFNRPQIPGDFSGAVRPAMQQGPFTAGGQF